VIMFNFRGDRAMELCRAFESGDDFAEFDRGRVPRVDFAGMMLYDGDLGVPSHYLVLPKKTEGCVSEYLAASGVTQFACAETQKYGHVTYFWNGNRSGMFDESRERYLEIPSDSCTFDQRPWMKAAETADALVAAIDGGEFRFIRANFAGGDMVGHTGRLLPTIVALEAIDISLARVLDAVRRAGGCLVVTADHGNAEEMVEREGDGTPKRGDDGEPKRRTSHSLNPVPFAVADFGGRGFAFRDIERAGLGNIAATLVELLGFEVPEGYDPSLLRP
jgi:2,3-bisphosphoglycerate-independent phosphoglycerate mutase